MRDVAEASAAGGRSSGEVEGVEQVADKGGGPLGDRDGRLLKRPHSGGFQASCESVQVAYLVLASLAKPFFKTALTLRPNQEFRSSGESVCSWIS